MQFCNRAPFYGSAITILASQWYKNEAMDMEDLIGLNPVLVWQDPGSLMREYDARTR
jgi:hypothetical protein